MTSLCYAILPLYISYTLKILESYTLFDPVIGLGRDGGEKSSLYGQKNKLKAQKWKKKKKPKPITPILFCETTRLNFVI